MLRTMLMQMFVAATGFGLLGLVAGYGAFAKTHDGALPPGLLLPSGESGPERAGATPDIDSIHSRILACGGIGWLIGVFIPILAAPKPNAMERRPRAPLETG